MFDPLNFLNTCICFHGLQYCGKNDFKFNHSLGMQLLSLMYNNFNNYHITSKSNAITLVSFASDTILSGYAAYSFSLNSFYALKRNYSLSLFTPSLSGVFDPIDYRWSRVKILNWMFEGTGSNLSDKYSSYFVWIDADLIFLDFEFDILQDVIFYDNRTKHADIIISAENHAETGVANTGCFIIKNSSWSRQFLSQWWQEDNSTRASAHDQIFFDRLYKRYLKENPIETHLHIVVLPTRALNSMPPALFQLAESDRVLHLMGERDELREVVFSYALQQWCCSSRFRDSDDSKSSYDPMHQGRLARPLLITPDKLIDISYGWYSATLSKVIQFIDNSVSFIAFSTTINTASQGCDVLSHFVDLFEKVGEARELLLQIRNFEYRLNHDLSMSAKSLEKIFHTLISSSRQFQSLFPYSQGIPQCHHAVTEWSYNYFRLHLNNLCSLIGNDYLGILSEASGWTIRSPSLSPSLEEQANMYSVVEDCLYSMEAVTDLASKPAVLSALAIFLQNMGAFYLSRSGSRHHHKGLQILQRSVDILWKEIPEGSVNPFQKVSPALLLGSALCNEDASLFKECIGEEAQQGECTSAYDDVSSRLRRGEELLTHTIELLEQLLFAEQQQKEDHFNYAKALFTAANCRRLRRHLQLHPQEGADPHMQKLIRLRDRFCLIGENDIVEEGSKLCQYLNETLYHLRYLSNQTNISTWTSKIISNKDISDTSRKKKKIRLSRRL